MIASSEESTIALKSNKLSYSGASIFPEGSLVTMMYQEALYYNVTVAAQRKLSGCR